MYGWLITKDLIDPDGAFDVGTCGPQGVPDALLTKLKAGQGEAFKMFDDDGILYYKGLILGAETGFEPLDDYGMPGAGCTEIQYRSEKTGKFETL